MPTAPFTLARARVKFTDSAEPSPDLRTQTSKAGFPTWLILS